MVTMNHVCIHVLDLSRSLTFYQNALGLTPQREVSMPDRGWELVFLGDGVTAFQLELCQETRRTQPFVLGDDTPHVALTADDFDALKAKHREMGLIFDELSSGIYFIRDPDGHVLEILPRRT